MATSPPVSELRTLAEIESEALKLELAERLELVKLIAGTIDEQPGELAGDDRSWWVEIDRRVNEIRQGTVAGRDGDTVIREALARFS